MFFYLISAWAGQKNRSHAAWQSACPIPLPKPVRKITCNHINSITLSPPKNFVSHHIMIGSLRVYPCIGDMRHPNHSLLKSPSNAGSWQATLHVVEIQTYTRNCSESSSPTARLRIDQSESGFLFPFFPSKFCHTDLCQHQTMKGNSMQFEGSWPRYHIPMDSTKSSRLSLLMPRMTWKPRRCRLPHLGETMNIPSENSTKNSTKKKEHQKAIFNHPVIPRQKQSTTKIIPNSFRKPFIHSTAVSTSSTQGSVCQSLPTSSSSCHSLVASCQLYDVISNLLDWGTSYSKTTHNSAAKYILAMGMQPPMSMLALKNFLYLDDGPGLVAMCSR